MSRTRRGPPSARDRIESAAGRAGQVGKCMHRRCEGCYDLVAHKRVVRFCAGSSVDPKRYAEWHGGFRFLDGVQPAVVDGGFKLRKQQWKRGADVPGMVLQGARAEVELSEAPQGEYKGVRLCEGVFGETGKDDGGDGQGSESCESRWWIESITFEHRGS